MHFCQIIYCYIKEIMAQDVTIIDCSKLADCRPIEKREIVYHAGVATLANVD